MVFSLVAQGPAGNTKLGYHLTFQRLGFCEGCLPYFSKMLGIKSRHM